MGHLQSTVKKMETDEAHAAYDGGWESAGPPLAVEPTEAELAEALARGPGPIIQRHVDLPVSRETLPGIGHIVVYHLRKGDSRNRRWRFPAIVMDVDHDLGELKLWVIVDDGDTWMQDRVPARVAPEPGWERVERDVGAEQIIIGLTSLRKRIEALEEAREGGFMQRVANLQARLDAIENHPALEVPPLASSAPSRQTKRRPRQTQQG